jgi:protein TonB
MATRLMPAAVVAVILHGLLLTARIPWTAPALLRPQSREVSIHLVRKATPEPKSPGTPPTQKPKPQATARPRPKPQPKPAPAPIPDRQTEIPVSPPSPPPVDTVAQVEPDVAPLPEAETPPPPESFESATESSAAADEPGATVHLSVPLYDLNPTPNYPRVARRRRYEGTVLLDVLVDPTGNAAQVKVIQSSGYALLDRSAAADVGQWRFKPARRGSRPVEMWVQVPVRYQLDAP